MTQKDVFWNNKKVAVTGADGFIGSHLVELLLSKGAHVKALSLYNSFNSWGWLDDIGSHDQLSVVTGDIRDSSFCTTFVADVEYVFHLAALIAIPYSYVSPESYVDTNIKGTLNMLQAIKSSGGRMIHTSTSEVYGTAKYVPITEFHPLQGQSPYSASKIGADALVESFHRSFGVPITIARPFNTFGPRQSARAVIPAIIIQLASGAETVRLGDITTTRDFNYVRDTCAGMIALAESDKTIGQVVNICSNSEKTIEDVFLCLKEIMRSDVELETDDSRIRPEKSEVRRLWGDNELITTLTQWKPEFSFKEALEETVDWFCKESNLSKYKSHIYNM